MTLQPVSGGTQAVPTPASADLALRTAARHACLILNRALTTTPPLASLEGGELAPLIALITRAKGLLATLEEPSGAFMTYPFPQAQVEE